MSREEAWNSNQYSRQQETQKKPSMWDFLRRNKPILFGVIGVLFLVVLFLALIFNPIVIVKAGTRGVVMNWGAVQNKVLGEGFHIVTPVYQSVVKMDVRVQKAETPADASSKDLQDAHSTIALNYHIDPDKAWWVYQNIGVQFKERIIDPQIQEIFKAVTAHYTAVELITQREKVRNETKDLLTKRFIEYGLIVDDISIVNFKFSTEFTKAIEAKQTAEQHALKAQNDLKRIEIEAKQKIASAQAEAESLRLQKQQVTAELIELRRIEAQIKAIDKWNGQMPQITGGAMPWVSADKFTK